MVGLVAHQCKLQLQYFYDVNNPKYVLCLHGYAMNPQWLREWLNPIQQQLSGEIEFIYPQAPIVVTRRDIKKLTQRFGNLIPSERIGENENWCWYRSTDSTPPLYRDIEQSIEQLSLLDESLGHVDGIIGWSQGAVMATVLIGQMLSARKSNFQFNWAVLGGGFLPRDVRFQSYYKDSLSLPSLHILGEKEIDFMKKRGHKLSQAFQSAKCLNTPAAHIMPVKYPEKMRAIAQWIQVHSN